MRRTAWVLAAAASLVLGAAAPEAGAAARPADCTTRFDVAGADCRTITVPLDRSGKVPGKVTLFTELVKSPKPSKSAIVLFPGGPGAAASVLGNDLKGDFGKSLEDHDLLLFDQRGTGRSGYLDCDVALTPTYFVPVGENSHQLGKTVQRCAKKLGAKRAFYTTRETVSDLEDVRVALHLDKLALVGVSYGTRDAMAYAEAYPEHVDRVVLDSLVTDAGLDAFGLNRVRALPRLLRQLCRGGGCDGITTDPVADLTALTARLAKGPMHAKNAVTFAGCALRPPITRTRVFEVIQQADQDPDLAAQLPVAFAEAAKGHPFQLSQLEAQNSPYLFGCLFEQLFKQIIGHLPTGIREDLKLSEKAFSTADQIATLCEESPLPWPRDALPAQRGRLAEEALASMPDEAFAPLDRATVLATSLVPLCKFWMAGSEPAPPPPDDLPDLPTLIIAGLDDLRTPAEDALALARTAPRSNFLPVPDVGHSVITSSACARRALWHFLASETIGECHRTAQHKPAPSKRVKSLQALLDEALKEFPGLTSGRASAR